MKSNLEILLMISVLGVMNIDNTFSVKCYQCNLCPVPMDYSSPLVTVDSSCKWCASLTIGSPYLTMKGCSDTCSSNSSLKKYVDFNYTCCIKIVKINDDDYFKLSFVNVTIYHLFRVLLLLLFREIGEKYSFPEKYNKCTAVTKKVNP
ncbi:unnamed protein product [Schistosoma turkestanicum]|nr:unnamed protein product [Schistosoma turkestanicum]